MLQKSILSYISFLTVFYSIAFGQDNVKIPKALASEKQTIDLVSPHYKNAIQNFYISLHDLENLEATNCKEEELKTTFLKTREAFKHIEFLLQYNDYTKYKQYNEANVIKLKYEVNYYETTKKPHGLQVIEDYIYNPSDSSRLKLKEEILFVKALIEKDIARVNKVENGAAIGFNYTFWDAIKREIIRLETLGISGFDVPNSHHVIAETKSIFTGFRDFIQLYEGVFKEKQKNELYTEGIQLIDNTLNFLNKQKSYNSFNRLDFIIHYLHPFQAWLNQVTKQLNYPFPPNFNRYNPNAANIFAPDFFNTTFINRSFSESSIKLGEKLFYSTLLSKDHTRSCATCHDPKKGFADGLKTNTSIDGKENLKRNTPTLINVAYQTRFFYDLRAVTIEAQNFGVIHNDLEMGGDLEKALDTILQIPEYKNLIDSAYQYDITSSELLIAISDYLRTLNSFNSKFDQFMQGDTTLLNSSEKNGFNLYIGKAQCATCHFMPVFNGLVPPFFDETEAEIIGVPAAVETPNIIDDDMGRYEVTKAKIHRYAFKTTSLRNIELTAPYMHNGVFNTLEEVVEFYNNGGGVGHGMHLPNQSLPADSLHLTEQEKIDLVNFMKTLTDEAYR